MFVIWQWTWPESDSESSCSNDSVTVIPGTPQSVDSDDEEDKSGDASLAVRYDHPHSFF